MLGRYNFLQVFLHTTQIFNQDMNLKIVEIIMRRSKSYRQSINPTITPYANSKPSFSTKDRKLSSSP